jgi:hypothetical protein
MTESEEQKTVDRAGPAMALALIAASLYGLIPSFARAAYDSGIPAKSRFSARASL